MTKM